ncbi:motility accessory factor [Campylobacter novaezeelandiae]|nr:motility associated factor glycosyltransferase family protein [Campylobacter novaezeelandiae]QWU79726.1 motility accessory factor [Campylobacter novaezeelandiae]
MFLKELFERNLNSLRDIALKNALSKIKINTKYQLIEAEDKLNINLKDRSTNALLYQNPLTELNSLLNTYNDKYFLYPVLYFYGFGNGILFKALLQNKNHKHIVVFEKELEIIYIMFHLIDFCHELKNNSLIILNANTLNLNDYNELCSSNPFFSFSRVYFLELSSDYYEKYKEDILNINQNMMSHFKKAIFSYGNDPLDALQGIEQFTYNLPKMITNSTFKELLTKRSNLSDTAIIVSTGPSLTKQLPILKEYQNKATIFCADSAYAILAKHGIKPDYVCMLERKEITAEFFNNDFKEFDEGITFILKSVVHPKALSYLDQNKRSYMVISTWANFINYVAMDKFGYFNMGHSVANVNFALAFFLKHKNIILIGQDLAYDEKGNSHPSDYKHGSNFESKRFKNFDKVLSYGGKKLINTHQAWTLFRQEFESDIQFTKEQGITTYNCTEGGARIEGSLEKPFKEVCEELLIKDLNKPFKKLNSLNKNKQDELLLKAYAKIIKAIKHSNTFKNDCLKEYEELNELYLSLNHTENQSLLDIIIQRIDKYKVKTEDLKELAQAVGAFLIQFELNLARIYVLKAKTKEDSFNKSLIWIKEHLEWLKMIYAHINALELALIKNIKPLEEELYKRGLEKWMRQKSYF